MLEAPAGEVIQVGDIGPPGVGAQLRASALASARTLTPAGEVGAPSGGVGRSAGVPQETDEIPVPVVMAFPLKGITGSTSRKAHYVLAATESQVSRNQNDAMSPALLASDVAVVLMSPL